MTRVTDEAILKRYLSYIILLLFITAVTVSYFKLSNTTEIDKTPFVDFPINIGSWLGESKSMDIDIVSFLELSDYALINYTHNDRTINLYVAYYENLSGNAFPHSPSKCIPGGGWKIESIENIQVSENKVRRVSIEKDRQKQIVYYWYQQGENIIPDEFRLKLNTFYRSFKEKRTDTALVRLTLNTTRLESELSPDRILQDFMKVIVPELNKRLQ